MPDGPVNNNDCKLYYTPDTGGSPTWVLIARAKNANLATSATTADSTSRESEFETEEVNTVKIGPLTFDYRQNAEDDTVFDALRAAHVAKTKLRFAQMTGAIATSGSEGWTFWGQITKCDVVEAEGGIRQASVEVVPTAHYESGSLVEPSWLEVA